MRSLLKLHVWEFWDIFPNKKSMKTESRKSLFALHLISFLKQFNWDIILNTACLESHLFLVINCTQALQTTSQSKLVCDMLLSVICPHPHLPCDRLRPISSLLVILKGSHLSEDFLWDIHVHIAALSYCYCQSYTQHFITLGKSPVNKIRKKKKKIVAYKNNNLYK